MRPDCEEARVEAFHFMLVRTCRLPVEEFGIVGALSTVMAAYLIGVEKLLHTEAKKVAIVEDGEMFRRSEMRPTETSKSNVRLRTIATIFAAVIYFHEVSPSREMVDLLGLLASLAVDDSEAELGDIAQDVVIRAIVVDPDLWDLVARECPWICKAVEKTAH